jgi:hypothetical protein
LAEKVAEGLRESDAMVIIVSPDSLQRDRLKGNWNMHWVEITYRNRVITVLVGQADQLPEERIPWILRKLKVVRQAGSPSDAEESGKIAEALRGAA